MTRTTTTTIITLPSIRFAPGSADIAPDELARVEQAASACKSHPELVSIDVAGNAQPDEANNVELSKARASRVVQELLRLGVEAQRMTAVAYGAACDPHARVVFKVVATSHGPTGVARGCAAARDAGLGVSETSSGGSRSP